MALRRGRGVCLPFLVGVGGMLLAVGVRRRVVRVIGVGGDIAHVRAAAAVIAAVSSALTSTRI